MAEDLMENGGQLSERQADEAVRRARSDFSEAEGAYENAQGAYEKAEEAEDGAFTSYVRNVSSLKASYRQIRSTLKNSAKTKKEADAENQAKEIVADGGIISIAKAMELLDTEKEASRKHSENSAKALNAAAQYVSEAVFSGAQVLWNMGGETVDGFIDTLQDKGSVLALAGGGLMGGVLGGTAGGRVASIVSDFMDLENNNETEAETKYVPGLENEEEYNQYLAENGNGEGYNSYYAENGGDGTEAAAKPLPEPSSAGAREDLSDDALSMGEEGIKTVADLEKLLSRATEQTGLGLASAIESKDAPEGGNAKPPAKEEGEIDLEGDFREDDLQLEV